MEETSPVEPEAVTPVEEIVESAEEAAAPVEEVTQVEAEASVEVVADVVEEVAAPVQELVEEVSTPEEVSAIDEPVLVEASEAGSD